MRTILNYAIMILQTKAETLTALMAKHGGKSRQLTLICDDIILARVDAGTAHIPDNASNDRTTLNHQKKTNS